MPKQSAGILLYKYTATELQVLLVHPGGPFYKNKDEGSWSIPKGEYTGDEEPLTAARREFEEETGQPIGGDFIEFEPIKQKGGKTVLTWAVEGDIDHSDIKSNLFEMEWPPRSGKMASFPEVDRAGWFNMVTAGKKILPSQVPILVQLIEKLKNK